VATAGGVYCLLKGHPGARYFLLAWTLLLVAVAVMAMRNMGWLPTTTLTNYSMQIGSSLEMLLLSFALADRINVMRRKKDAATHEALVAKQAMVDALRRSEQDLERRVAERTHELEQTNQQLRLKERELEHLARHDALTGLPNRNVLEERIEQVIARIDRHGRTAAVLLVDVDEFKRANDLYGHAVGDLLLVAAAQRLKQCVRETDMVTRFGGDEFVIVLNELNVDKAKSEQQAKIVAEKICSTLCKPYMLKIQHKGEAETVVEHHCSSSIGVTLFVNHVPSAEDVLKRGDMAMYQAKEAGGNQIRFYEETPP
jgi:diguanylate cyclase (GGDEF)-like protein